MKGKEGKLPMGEKRNSFIIISFVSYFLDKKSVLKPRICVKIHPIFIDIDIRLFPDDTFCIIF